MKKILTFPLGLQSKDEFNESINIIAIGKLKDIIEYVVDTFHVHQTFITGTSMGQGILDGDATDETMVALVQEKDHPINEGLLVYWLEGLELPNVLIEEN